MRGYSFYKNIIKYYPYGNGHINKTYLVETNEGKYILQQINSNVFKKPKDVMKNIDLITKYIKKKKGKTLELVKDRKGKKLRKIGECYWRCYKYIENGITFEKIDNDDIFYEVGKAVGNFQKELRNFPIDKLRITIPDFHNTKKRYEKLFSVINNNEKVNSCIEEIRFVSERKQMIFDYMKVIEEKVPLRVTHNDTKLNNVMMNNVDKKSICLIDLDTVMPGSILFDFGDAIRIGASTALEDEKDLRKVRINKKLFEKFTEGFLEETKDILTLEEKQLLVESCKIITLECGIRFLTDFLENDIYFKTEYYGHNLIRARNQFKLVKEFEQKEEVLLEIVKKVYNRI